MYYLRKASVFIVTMIGCFILFCAVGLASAAADPIISLNQTDNMLELALDTGSLDVSAFSLEILHDGTTSPSCQSDLTRLNCNPAYDEITVRANYYSAQSALTGNVALLQIILDDSDATEFCLTEVQLISPEATLIDNVATTACTEIDPFDLTPASVASTKGRSTPSTIFMVGVILFLIAVSFAVTRYIRRAHTFVLLLGVFFLGLAFSPSYSVSAQGASTLGDLNCDATVDIIDALLADQYVNEMKTGVMGCPSTGGEINQPACDTDLDTTCSAEDAAILARCDAGFKDDIFCNRVEDSTDSYVIIAADPNDLSALDDIAFTLDAYDIDVYDTMGVMSVNGLYPEDLAELLTDSALLIEPNSIVELYDVPSWGLDRIDQRNLPLDDGFTPSLTGAGVHAYIVDTGIRSTHDEFVGRIGDGYSSVSGDANEDCQGHGTHVAGTVGGTTYGVATEVTLHSVRVFGCGRTSSTKNIIDGINWIRDNYQSPAVINMSLGGRSSLLAQLVKRSVLDDDLTYVVAAGNNKGLACDKSPARVADAITVGATRRDDQRSRFSNHGSCVDLFAPGTAIVSASFLSDSGSRLLHGTSMAAPHVAGAVALYLEQYPSASASQVESALVSMATDNVLSDTLSDSPNKLLYIGDIVPPTITPTPEPPSGSGNTLTVIKQIAGDPAPATLFDVQVNGINVLTTAGSYTEDILIGEETGVRIGEPVLPIDPAGGTWRVDSSCEQVQNFVDNGDGTVTVDFVDGLDATCTFINTYTAPTPTPEPPSGSGNTLTVIKQIAGDPAPATLFDVQVNGVTVLTTAGSYTEDILIGEEIGVRIGEPVLPIDPAGGTWRVDSSCEQVQNFVDNGDGTVTVDFVDGLDATCTFINTYTAPTPTPEPQPGSGYMLTVIKQIAGDPAPATLFDIQVDGVTVLTTAGTYTEEIPIGGRKGVTIGEPVLPVAPAGGMWSFNGNCQQIQNPVNNGDGTFTVDLVDGFDATCTFVNTYTAPTSTLTRN